MITLQDRPARSRPALADDLPLQVRRRLPLLLGLAVGLAVFAGSLVYVNPGHVGIVIHRAGGGVDRQALGPGFHVRLPLVTGIEEYPIFMQTLVLTQSSDEGSPRNEEINVNSVEGQPISMDVSLSFELNRNRAPKLYETFRAPIDEITHGYVRQTIRQALQEVIGREEIAAILGPRKALVVGQTQALLRERLEGFGIVVRQFTINEMRPPQEVLAAINAKNVMQQQALTAQNELQRTQFQATGDSIEAAGDAKAILGRARAQAEANELLSRSITPTLVQYEQIKKWDGKLPQVSGGATPLIQMPRP